MIRALIGRFILHCLDHAAARAMRRPAVHVIDPDRMTDRQIDAWVAGQVIDFRQTRCRRLS